MVSGLGRRVVGPMATNQSFQGFSWVPPLHAGPQAPPELVCSMKLRRGVCGKKTETVGIIGYISGYISRGE